MRFGVLGPLEVWSDGRVLACGGPKQQKVLATLLLSYGQAVAIGRLVDAVWETDPPKTAEKQVRNAISDLRRVLPDDAPGLELVTGGYRLDAGDHLDAVVFARKVEHAKRLAAEQPVEAIAEFRGALALWRGEVVAGLDCAGLGPQVVRLRELRLAAFEDCVELRLEQGEHRSVVGELSAWTREFPLRERLTGQLVLALHRSGAAAEATLAYHEFRGRVKEELGIEPSSELQMLHQQILRNDKTVAAPGTWFPRCDLPHDTSSFTGRGTELGKLAESAALAGSTMVISAIDGMAGVGKTALAIHAAHRLAPQFPDGQLFLDLHAHTPGQAPLTPMAALERLLCALGVEQERIPHELDDRAALWRAQLAERRVLVVLDNATNTRQIEPLLPGARGCLTIATSRHRLVGLDATLLMLEVLPAEDALGLFHKVVGDDRPLAEPDATREVLELCGYLPLAVRIAGSRLRHRPSWTVGYLASRLRDQRSRVDELGTEEQSVASAFTLSYEQLPAESRTLFRLLGNTPGADIDPHAAAALAGGTAFGTETILERLVDAHLLLQFAPGRYHFHDLLRSYAANLSLETDSASQRHHALGRLFDHYLQTAAAAMNVVTPTERIHRPAVPETLLTRPLSAYPEALGWLDAERHNLLTAAKYGSQSEWLSHAAEFSGTLWRYFHISGHHHDALALHQYGLDAARTAGNMSFQADTLSSLGYTNWWLGRYPQALADCSEAVRLAKQAGDRSLTGRALHALGLVHTRLGADLAAQAALEETRVIGVETKDRILEGYALRGLGEVYCRLDQWENAITAYEHAADIAREVGNITVEGYAVRALGELYSRQGEHDRGLAHCTRALELARLGGNRNIQTRALRTLGEIHREAGRYDVALGNYEEALRIADETGNRYELACAHDGMAHTRLLQGDPITAADYWDQALKVFDELNVPEAAQVRNHLAGLTNSGADTR